MKTTSHTRPVLLPRRAEQAAAPVTGEMPLPPRCTCHADVPVVSSCALQIELTDGDHAVCRSRILSLAEAVIGPLQATTCLRGEFVRPDGLRAFQFRLCVTTYGGDTRFKIEPMIVVDDASDMRHSIRQLRLLIRRAAATRDDCRVGIDGAPRRVRHVLQLDDRHCVLDAAGAPQPARLDGWAQSGGLTLALAKPWQQWPKSFEFISGGLACGLLPAFTPGLFDHMQPWCKDQCLFEGDVYLLRAGERRSWTLWVDSQGGDGPALAILANQPSQLQNSLDSELLTSRKLK